MQIEKIVREELEWLKEQVIARMQETGTTVTGETARSIEISIIAIGDGVEAFLLGRPAFSTVEKGRGPGGVPHNIIEIIKKWIKDKGISVKQIPYKRELSEKWQPKYTVEERSLNMAAGAISHTIATKGTKLHRDGGREDIYTPFIDEFIERLDNRIFTDFKTEILKRL